MFLQNIGAPICLYKFLSWGWLVGDIRLRLKLSRLRLGFSNCFRFIPLTAFSGTVPEFYFVHFPAFVFITFMSCLYFQSGMLMDHSLSYLAQNYKYSLFISVFISVFTIQGGDVVGGNSHSFRTPQIHRLIWNLWRESPKVIFRLWRCFIIKFWCPIHSIYDSY